MRISAETRLNASSHIQMRRASTHLASSIQQSPANHEQVRECGHHLEAMPILIESSITHLLKAEDSNKAVADLAIVCSALLLESNRFEKAREGFLDIVQRLDVG